MILINGQASECIQPLDRGLMYGDGVFRTLPIREGNPVCWQLHYQKLHADCGALGINCPPDDVLKQDIERIAHTEKNCVIKIVITRGIGARGYLPMRETPITRIIFSSPLPSPTAETGATLHVCQLRLAHQPRLAGIKHLNRLENVLARMEWDDASIEEGVMLDIDGYVIEGTMSNLFMRYGKILHTPDLTRCGVSGVTRERIMALAPALDMDVAVGNYTLAFLQGADEVLFCNSVRGIRQALKCQEKQWEKGPLAAKINNLLDLQEN